MTSYDGAFYTSINEGSRSSAQVLLPILLDLITVGSVADFGCGQGAWLNVWRELGIEDVVGVDGDYVDRAALLIDSDHFVGADLCRSVDLGRRFDVVQSLEVAEHLPESAAQELVQTLVRHGDVVIFSAAVPGQGGTDHVNERPREWWRRLFAAHGYVVLDPFRRRLCGEKRVKRWYQYNTLLYVRAESLVNFPSLQPFQVPRDQEIQDVSPVWYKLRKVVLAQLPVRVINRLARLNIQLQRS